MEVDPIFPISTDPVAMLEARSELRVIDREIDKMQPRYAEMFSRHLMGWDLGQIATEFGLSAQTVGGHVRDVRYLLKYWRCHDRPRSAKLGVRMPPIPPKLGVDLPPVKPYQKIYPDGPAVSFFQALQAASKPYRNILLQCEEIDEEDIPLIGIG